MLYRVLLREEIITQPSAVSDLRHHLELQDGDDIHLNPDIAVVNLNVFRK